MIVLDIHESAKVERLIGQSVETYRTDINRYDFADYMWHTAGNELEQFENKSWTELLWNIGHCEDQLRRQITAHGRTSLVVRGMMLPVKDGVTAYKVEGGRLIRQRQFKEPYAKIMAWLWALNREGVSSYQVPDEEALAQFLVAAYRNGQKTEHRTLRRYVRQTIADVWVPNHHVASLLGMRGPGGKDIGIGEVRATALVNSFKTTWAVLSANIDELCSVPGIGKTTATRLLESIGRKVP